MTNIPENIISVTNKDSVTFNVRRVVRGQSYGRNMCLTNQDEDPFIEFYDASGTSSIAPDGTVLGFFVSRYYEMTLIKREPGYGLDLCGYARKYYCDSGNMDDVINFIYAHNNDFAHALTEQGECIGHLADWHPILHYASIFKTSKGYFSILASQHEPTPKNERIKLWDGTILKLSEYIDKQGVLS